MHRRNRKSTTFYTTTVDNTQKLKTKMITDHKQNIFCQTQRKEEIQIDILPKTKITRIQLAQIVTNNIYPLIQNLQNPISCKLTQLISHKNRYYPHFHPKLKQNFIKNRQIHKKNMKKHQISQGLYNNSSKTTNIRIIPQKSQKSQFQQTQNKQLNRFTAKCNILLQYNNNNNNHNKYDKSKSRALMNYSQVYKNNQKDRFKVRINKSLIVKFRQLSSHKLRLQEKYKSQHQKKKSRLPRSYVLSSNMKNRLNYHKNRYEESQQFDIQGWDYN